MPLIAPYNLDEIDAALENLLQTLPTAPFCERLQAAASHFLDRPYVFEPLGEGPEGYYDQQPLYRHDQFDCVSYVNTILALARARNLSEFKRNILQIRYQQRKIHYTQRTDWFTDLEWLPRSRELAWLENSSSQILDAEKQPLMAFARTIIDKPNWYRVKTSRALRFLQALPPAEEERRLEALRAEGKAFVASASSLAYLPWQDLFKTEGALEAAVFEQIPAAAVLVLVRPNWAIRDQFKDFPQGYGSNLNVGHLGLSLKSSAGRLFYHASSEEGRVVALPLEAYLRKFLDSELTKGIHVEKILTP